MADALTVTLRLTATDQGFRAEVIRAGNEVKKLGTEATGAGRQASAAFDEAGAAAGRLQLGVNSAGGAFGRLSSVVAVAQRGLAALGVGLSIKAIADAGDALATNLQRLGSATGNVTTASEVYDRLYASSLRTGAAVGDSVAAFTRFSVAARDIGATNEQVEKLIGGIQGFARLAGTSSAEMSAATLQLGQALASGTLQGDELRSVLEAMPQLAQALASQLGMSVGELRKAGSEGRLTAEQVFPALLRASEGVQRQLAGLPTTLAQGTGILNEATQRFLGQLDQAIGLSRRLASALAGAGSALDGVRQDLGLVSEGEQTDRDRKTLEQLRTEREALAQTQARLSEPGRRGSLRQAQSPEDALRRVVELDAEIERLQQKIDDDERDATARRLTNQAEADRQAAEGRRNRAQAAYDALREETDKEFKLRKEFAERVGVLLRSQREGVLTPEAARAETARLQKDLDDDLKKLRERGGAGGRPGQSTDLRLGLQVNAADAALRRSLDPVAEYNARIAELRSSLERAGINQDQFNRGVTEAEDRLNKTRAAAAGTTPEVDRLEKSINELGDRLEGTGKQAADSFARMTLGIDGARFSLGKLVQDLASGILSKVIQDEITTPVSRAIIALAKLGISSIGNLFSSGTLSGSNAAASGNLAAAGPSGLAIPPLHSGGIAGVEAPMGYRAMDARLFAAAPRFHGGGVIGADEVPAVLRKGEGVFTEAQMAALSPGGGTVITVIDQRGSNAPPVETEERRGAGGLREVRMLIRGEVKAGLADGGFDREMRGSYGLARRGA